MSNCSPQTSLCSCQSLAHICKTVSRWEVIKRVTHKRWQAIPQYSTMRQSLHRARRFFVHPLLIHSPSILHIYSRTPHAFKANFILCRTPRLPSSRIHSNVSCVGSYMMSRQERMMRGRGSSGRRRGIMNGRRIASWQRVVRISLRGAVGHW